MGWAVNTSGGSREINEQNREKAVDWARRMLANPGVIFLDTETTGLGDDAEIVDIAIIDRDGQVLIDTLVHPDGPVPDDSIAIHGLDEAALADAPSWPEIYPLIGRILDRYSPVVIYNADFDTRVLNQVNRRHGLPEFQSDWQCAMKRFAEYAGIWHPKHGTFRWHKLEDAVRMSNQPGIRDQHRARSDAESCRAVVMAMAEQQVSLSSPGVYDPPREGSEREWGSNVRTEEFPGGRITVFSTSQSCSRTMLIAVIVVMGLCVVMACCALIVFGARAVG